MKRVGVAVALLALVVCAGWVWQPQRAMVDCRNVFVDQRPTISLQANVLRVRYGVRFKEWLLWDFFDRRVEKPESILEARIVLEPLISPGAHFIQLTNVGDDPTLSPQNDPMVKGASLLLSPLIRGNRSRQTLIGTLIIETSTEDTLAGRVHLSAEGEVGCTGTASIETSFQLELKAGRDSFPKVLNWPPGR